MTRVPTDQPSVPRGPSVRRLGSRYAIGLTLAQLVTAGEVAAVVVSLSLQAEGAAASAFATRTNMMLAIGLIVAGLAATAYGGHRIVAPSLRWYVARDTPDAGQRRSAINLNRRQSVLMAATWVVGGAVMLAANTRAGLGVELLLLLAVSFGCTSSVSTGMLLTQRVIRPVVAAASQEFVSRETAPGVTARLVLMWLVNSALPTMTIAMIVVFGAKGWLIPRSASVLVPVVVLSAASVALSLRALILVSKSISDPLNDVVAAMAEVERGNLGRTVDVYEQSEIGRLQNGFNRMVAGLNERDRLRDLFDRHVGPDVARLAVESRTVDASDEVPDVAILFIDLAGSTQLPSSRSPREVADVLNDFFRIVVAAVDEHGGLINKFQGDAALAVFGAPVANDRAATSALCTARALADNLRALPDVDFGIGVSAGPVFAGNIGAENRYEYTVIGDPVNEAARLADAAKVIAGRALASGAATDRSDDDERAHWETRDPILLRGRPEPTRISVRRPQDPDHDRRDHSGAIPMNRRD